MHQSQFKPRTGHRASNDSRHAFSAEQPRKEPEPSSMVTCISVKGGRGMHAFLWNRCSCTYVHTYIHTVMTQKAVCRANYKRYLDLSHSTESSSHHTRQLTGRRARTSPPCAERARNTAPCVLESFPLTAR